MARSASRKSTRKMAPKRRVAKRSAGPKRAHRACVSRNAKAMHKKATTRRGHQLALKRAQKKCANK